MTEKLPEFTFTSQRPETLTVPVHNPQQQSSRLACAHITHDYALTTEPEN